MRNIIKSIFLINALIFVACDNNNNNSGNFVNEELGWVQFLDSSPDIISLVQGDEEELNLELNIQVPNTSTDLTVNYEIESIDGYDPSSIFNGNSVVVPAGQTSWSGPDNNTGIEYANLALLNLNLNLLPTLEETMTFDVTLTGTDNSSISAGVSGESFKTTQRISILCNTMPLAPTAAFSGSYDIVVSPASLFGPAIFDPQTVTLSGSGSTRTFDAIYLAGLGIGQPAMTFTFDFASCGSILVPEAQETNLACGGIPATLGPDNLLGTFDTNDDSSFTINATEFNTEACGVTSPSPITIVFTKI